MKDKSSKYCPNGIHQIGWQSPSNWMLWVYFIDVWYSDSENIILKICQALIWSQKSKPNGLELILNHMGDQHP